MRSLRWDSDSAKLHGCPLPKLLGMKREIAVRLKQIGNGIWIYQGSTVNFYGFPFPTRMTVVKLRNGSLWVHSPARLNAGLRDDLSNLGDVKYLVSPNKLHHLFLTEWINEYPDALKCFPPGLSTKRKDITFDVALTDKAEEAWRADIEQTIFRGSPAMEEVVFYHQLSKTLILTDLIENFDPLTLNRWQRVLARFAGILHPNGKMPIDWRVSFLFGDKSKARKSLDTMLSWAPENIILSHGECVFGNGTEFLRSSFSWLNK